MFQIILKHIYKSKKPNFGFIIALFSGKNLHWWLRHIPVAEIIKEFNPKTILDVGTNNSGLLYFFKDDCLIVSMDLKKPKNISKFFIHGDALSIPFKDKSFDVVCSIALLPQIAKNNRKKLFNELKRVGKKVVIHSEAIQDKNREYRGLDWEISFHENIIKQYKQTPYDLDKLKNRKVELDEIKSFSNNYFGIQNYDVTYKYWSLIYNPIGRYFSGLLYYFFWKKKDNFPPFKSCIAIFDSNKK